MTVQGFVPPSPPDVNHSRGIDGICQQSKLSNLGLSYPHSSATTLGANIVPMKKVTPNTTMKASSVGVCCNQNATFPVSPNVAQIIHDQGAAYGPGCFFVTVPGGHGGAFDGNGSVSMDNEDHEGSYINGSCSSGMLVGSGSWNYTVPNKMYRSDGSVIPVYTISIVSANIQSMQWARDYYFQGTQGNPHLVPIGNSSSLFTSPYAPIATTTQDNYGHDHICQFAPGTSTLAGISVNAPPDNGAPGPGGGTEGYVVQNFFNNHVVVAPYTFGPGGGGGAGSNSWGCTLNFNNGFRQGYCGYANVQYSYLLIFAYLVC